jgi:hypothetical protein
MAAKSPARRAVSGKIAAIERHNGPDDPRLDSLKIAGAALAIGEIGDFDPSGEDIDRDFTERTGCWDEVIRVALTAGQVRDYRLPVNPGKTTDSRAAGFIERHGSLMQVELDALDPDTLRSLFQEAISAYWDTSAYEAVLAREQEDLRRLREVAASGAG